MFYRMPTLRSFGAKARVLRSTSLLAFLLLRVFGFISGLDNNIIGADDVALPVMRRAVLSYVNIRVRQPVLCDRQVFGVSATPGRRDPPHSICSRVHAAVEVALGYHVTCTEGPLDTPAQQ